jgi:hypothetical protein
MAASVTCVPAWQNTLQGNCNKILSQLQTNVAYFERAARIAANNGDDSDNWVTWSLGPTDTTWTTLGTPGSRFPYQRYVNYPNTQPLAAVDNTVS